jgi:ABC-type transport system involved in multi-copper enzyme maturation permease subunit
MLRKILTITWKEVYLTFTDRSLLLIMIVAPLAISSIVGLAFGGLGGGGGQSSIVNIPVAVVNLDAGTTQQGQPLNYGDIFVNVLSPSTASGDTANSFGGDCPLVDSTTAGTSTGGYNVSLDQLLDTTVLNDVATGRTGVDDGTYAALIVIPADFSARLAPAISYSPDGPTVDTQPPTTVEVYGSEGMALSASIVRSIVQGFTDQLVGGNIAISATINTLIAANPLAGLALNATSDATAVFNCAFSGVLNTIQIDPRALAAETQQGDSTGFSTTTLILLQVGTAQAVFFALFTGQFGTAGIIQERKSWTLQRMVVSPTPRAVILAGNLLGTFTTVVFQIGIMLLALTAIASLVEGGLALIFGTNVLAIIAMLLVLALAVSALGILIAGIARTAEQSAAIGSVFNLIMGVLGGAFGVSVGLPLGYLSLIYWGTDGFNKLAHGQAGDIGLNLLVLGVQGIVLYLIGLFFFNHRLDI